MKRILKISFDLALLSFIPIISWFVLSITVDKNLINVFTLTYPLQFIFYILKSIFSTGANISKEKDKNNNAVMSGIIVGSIVGLLVFGFVTFNIDNYITFMNMDISTYRDFAIYSVIQLYIQLIFTFILSKLYYENKNTLANKYSLIFNILNFIVLVGSSLITKNIHIIILTTLVSILLFTLIIFIKSFDKFKLKFNIINFIKYDSTELLNQVFFFLIFLFGLSNALVYGEKYALALTFVALITDTQWDAFDSIVIAAKIDISKKQFNYKEHLRNSYKLLSIIFLSVFLLFICLYKFYNLDMKLFIIYLSFEIVNFLIYPVYGIKICYLQLEHSAIKTTGNKFISAILRFTLSLLKTPFCTGIGQVSASIYQFISYGIIFNKNYLINEDGFISKRK